nr:MAG TPA: hypothetical protein [Caudoviricetes sp.]
MQYQKRSKVVCHRNRKLETRKGNIIQRIGITLIFAIPKTKQGCLPPKPQTGNPKGKYKKVKGIL